MAERAFNLTGNTYGVHTTMIFLFDDVFHISTNCSCFTLWTDLSNTQRDK